MSPLALVSVSDKTNIIQFCKELVEEFDYKILSSGGTAKYLLDAKIPVTKIAEFTNSPEMSKYTENSENWGFINENLH